jgi:hypothetical protein
VEHTRTTRRGLLAATTGTLAALAGCGGTGSDTTPDRTPFDAPPRSTTATTDETPDDRPENLVPAGEDPLSDLDLRRAITGSLDARRYVLAAAPFSRAPDGTRLTAGFVRGPSRAGPARIAVAVTAANRERTVEFGPTPPFSAYRATPVASRVRRTPREPPEARYLLVPVDRSPYGDLTPPAPTDRGWVATADPGEPERPVERRTVTLAADESLVGRYDLLVHPEATPGTREAVQFDGEDSPTALGLGVYTSEAVSRETRVSRSVPDLNGPTRWYHEGEGTAFVRPDRERLSLPRDRTTVRLENYSSPSVAADTWRLYKLVDGRPRRVGPFQFRLTAPAPRLVPPAGTVSAELVVDARTDDRRPPGRLDAESLVLGPGTYAVEYGARSSGRVPPDTPLYVDGDATGPTVRSPTTADDDGETVDPTTRYAALFTVAGERPPLVPTDDVERVDRDGATVTVRVESRSVGLEADAEPVLVVERAPLGPTPPRLLLEQAYWFPSLRNALAQFEPGVDRVRVVSAAALGGRAMRFLAGLAGEDGDARTVVRFVYRDTTLSARTEEEKE